MVRYCPDLMGSEEVPALLVGQRTVARPVLRLCIKRKCIAYNNGFYRKYHENVEVEEDTFVENITKIQK